MFRSSRSQTARPTPQVVLALQLLLLLFSQGLSSAQSPQLAPEKRTQMEAAVARFMAASHAPGISVAVVENGVENWSAGFGNADLENSVPATSLTLYRLGSISKSITAVAALLLWQQGKLDLDAPVQKYCPAFPDKGVLITTRQVLGHIAGIRHYNSDSQDDPETGNTKHFSNPIQGGLDFFKNDPLVAKPGTEFHYSTQGYTLVGCVIEGASGTNYVDFVTKNVLLPAGMTHTVPDDRFAIIPLRTRFYKKNDDGVIQNADLLDSSYKIPGGGWLSSADDVAQFEVVMLSDRILTRATRDILWTPLKPTDGKPNDRAMGWDRGDSSGFFDVGNTGGQQGTATHFMIVPERRAGMVVLINVNGVDAHALAVELIRILLNPTQK